MLWLISWQCCCWYLDDIVFDILTMFLLISWHLTNFCWYLDNVFCCDECQQYMLSTHHIYHNYLLTLITFTRETTQRRRQDNTRGCADIASIKNVLCGKSIKNKIQVKVWGGEMVRVVGHQVVGDPCITEFFCLIFKFNIF